MKPIPVQPVERSLPWIMLGIVLVFCGFLFVLQRVWLVCYGSVKVEAQLKQILPHVTAPTGGVPEETAEVVLDLAADGTVSLNEEPVTDLALALKQLVADNQGFKILVTIACDEQARYEDVIRVMEALGKAGLKNITLAVGSEAF